MLASAKRATISTIWRDHDVKNPAYVYHSRMCGHGISVPLKFLYPRLYHHSGSALCLLCSWQKSRIRVQYRSKKTAGEHKGRVLKRSSIHKKNSFTRSCSFYVLRSSPRALPKDSLQAFSPRFLQSDLFSLHGTAIHPDEDSSFQRIEPLLLPL